VYVLGKAPARQTPLTTQRFDDSILSNQHSHHVFIPAPLSQHFQASSIEPATTARHQTKIPLSPLILNNCLIR
jgi:hypothetical protein